MFVFKVPVSSRTFFSWPETRGGAGSLFPEGSAGVFSPAESAKPSAASSPRPSASGCFLSDVEGL